MPVYNSVLKIADSVADAVGLLSRPLDADALLALAQRRSGLRDFGDMSFVEPLRRLMASCDDEASLSLVGRMATRWDVLRFLTNLLQFRDAERRAPPGSPPPISAYRPSFAQVAARLPTSSRRPIRPAKTGSTPMPRTTLASRSLRPIQSSP